MTTNDELRALAAAATPGPHANASSTILAAWKIGSVVNVVSLDRIGAQYAAERVRRDKLPSGAHLILSGFESIGISGEFDEKSGTPDTRLDATASSGPTTLSSIESNIGSGLNGSGQGASPATNSATCTSDPEDGASTAPSLSSVASRPPIPEASIMWCLALVEGSTASKTWSFAAARATQSSQADDDLDAATRNELDRLLADSDELARLRGLRESVALIATERQRQIDAEGYTVDHDHEHGWQLAIAGAAYALNAGGMPANAARLWPWDEAAWKPKDALRDLVRAGALIAAAIDVALTPPADRDPKAVPNE